MTKRYIVQIESVFDDNGSLWKNYGGFCGAFVIIYIEIAIMFYLKIF